MDDAIKRAVDSCVNQHLRKPKKIIMSYLFLGSVLVLGQAVPTSFGARHYHYHPEASKQASAYEQVTLKNIKFPSKQKSFGSVHEQPNAVPFRLQNQQVSNDLSTTEEEPFDIKKFSEGLVNAFDNFNGDFFKVFAEMLKRVDGEKSKDIYNFLRCVADLSDKLLNPNSNPQDGKQGIFKCLLNVLSLG